jgi:membrane-bound lytic murein transglycosylase MltF
MLAKGRFDALFRATAEAPDEVRQHAASMPDLAIEKTLLLYCPIARYFAFSRAESGRLLAARVTDGLNQIIRDGTFDRIFHRYYDALLLSLDLRTRRFIRLENPNLLPWEPAAANHSDHLPDWFPHGPKDSR